MAGAVTVLTVFPQGDSRRIKLPNFRGPEGLGSWRVPCPRQHVPVFDETNPVGGADDNGLFPIQAVYVGCNAITLASQGCARYQVFENDCLSRCTIYLDAIGIRDNYDFATPMVVNWAIKQSASGVSELLLSGSLTFAKGSFVGTVIGPVGEVASVNAPLCNQFEFWASVEAASVSGIDHGVMVAMQFAVDRVEGDFNAYLGQIAGGTGLPIVNQKGP
jgi:hypothetical protein